MIDLAPELVPMARANRAFMHRAAAAGAEQHPQLIDIGTGIPTAPNTHQVAHEVSARRAVYVDNDPIVATHAGAHLVGAGNTGFFLGDLRDPQSILNHPTIGTLIDFDQPVGLMLMAILHFVQDDEDAAGLVAAYLETGGLLLVLAAPPPTSTSRNPNWSHARDVYRDRRATAALTLRVEQVLGLFDLDLLEPGLVQAPLWRPDGPAPTARSCRTSFSTGASATSAGAQESGEHDPRAIEPALAVASPGLHAPLERPNDQRCRFSVAVGNPVGRGRAAEGRMPLVGLVEPRRHARRLPL